MLQKDGRIQEKCKVFEVSWVSGVWKMGKWKEKKDEIALEQKQMGGEWELWKLVGLEELDVKKTESKNRKPEREKNMI